MKPAFTLQTMDVLIRLLNPLLMVALPLALGTFLARRLRVGWGVFGLGVLTFLGSQLLHLPFNLRVLSPALAQWGIQAAAGGRDLVLTAMLFGLSAGVFEETARYLAFRLSASRGWTWAGALMFGAGHGGLEAILTGGVAFYGLLQALALQGADLAAVVPPEQLDLARAQLSAYWAAPWHLILLGAFERAGALALHLSLSVLVWQSVQRRRLIWLALAVAWHTLANAGALLALDRGGPYAAEALVLAVALLSLGLVRALRPPEPAPSAQPVPAPARAPLPQGPPTAEQLEDSRYV